MAYAGDTKENEQNLVKNVKNFSSDNLDSIRHLFLVLVKEKNVEETTHTFAEVKA